MTGDSFLVIGESVADVVRTSDGTEQVYPGGSPMNVAHGLARLGRSVTLVTEIAEDPHGTLIRRHLAASGVILSVGGQPVQRTPSAVASLNHAGTARYTFDIAWTLRKMPNNGTAATHLHTGSIAAFLEPGATAVEQELIGHRQRGTTSFDPNVRPALLQVADARRRAERLVRLSDVVKASEEDLNWLYPDDEPAAVAARWSTLGPALVVVTKGSEGAVAVKATDLISIEPVPVVIADTVGAGDAFMSALLDGLATAGLLGAGGKAQLDVADSGVLRPVLNRAARAAAITVSRAGANPPTIKELRTGPEPV